MFENKKTIIVASISTVIIIVGSFFLGSWNERRIIGQMLKSGNVKTQDAVATSQDVQQMDESYVAAVKSGDVNSCKALDTAEKKNQCKNEIIINQASESKNKTKCAQLQDAQLAKNCQDSISLSTAADGDVAACDSIPDAATKAGCVFNAWNSKAVKAKDASICDNIAEQMNKDLCRENVKTFMEEGI